MPPQSELPSAGPRHSPVPQGGEATEAEVTRIDLRAALDMLPRWNYNNSWSITGRKTMINGHLLPKKVDTVIKKLMRRGFHLEYKAPIEYVDVSGDNVWVLHRVLLIRSLMYLYKKNWHWQNWPRHKLPVYIRYHGKLVIWNGTHRMTLCRLAGRKVRARIYDVDKYIAWRAKHGD